jgi:hypothetical protein
MLVAIGIGDIEQAAQTKPVLPVRALAIESIKPAT